jgi:DNA-binding transcriptional LysR family regulator
MRRTAIPIPVGRSWAPEPCGARRVDLIEDGIDVALRVGAIMHDPMVARRILSFRHILVASPELVERFGLPDEPDALHRFPCAVWASLIDVTARWALGGHVIEPKPVLATNDYHHLCSRALRGDVVTELPPFLAAAPIREKRLVPLLPQYPSPEWAHQSALSASPSPIHYRQGISGLLPELSSENCPGLRNLS